MCDLCDGQAREREQRHIAKVCLVFLSSGRKFRQRSARYLFLLNHNFCKFETRSRENFLQNLSSLKKVQFLNLHFITKWNSAGAKNIAITQWNKLKKNFLMRFLKNLFPLAKSYQVPYRPERTFPSSSR